MPKSIRLILRCLAAGLLAIGGSGCSRQARRASHLQQAEHYFADGQFDKAEIEYLNVLQIEPLDPQAIGRLGSIYFDQGRINRVMPFLSKGRELQPENLDLRLKLGMVDLASGKLKEARDEANFILDRRPSDPEAPLLLVQATTAKPEDIEATRQRLLQLPPPAAEGTGVILALGTLEFRLRHFKEAEAAFRRALDRDPGSSPAQAAMGALYQMQNDLPRAEQAFKRAAELAPARSSRGLLYAKFKVQNGDGPAGRKALEEITRKTPDFLPAWILLAELTAAENKYSESAGFVAKVLALDPAHPEALLLSARLKLAQKKRADAVEELEKLLKLYPQFAQAHYFLGQAQYAGGDLANAAASLNRAIALAPGFAEAVVLHAELDLRNGDYRMAIDALRSLIQQRPEIVPPRFLLAEAFRAQGDFDAALLVYRQLEEAFPKNPQAHYWEGTIFLQQDKRAEAKRAFGQALVLAPDYMPAVEQLLNIDLAEKDYARALQRADGQIAKDPKLPEPYLLQAKVFMAQAEPAKAESALRKAIELQPNLASPYLLLARLYAGSNQLDRALANFQAVIARNPRNIEAMMLIGTIQNQKGDFVAARESYEKLLAENPGFSPALNNLAYLYSEQFNELDKAQEMALKARDLLPHEPHTGDTLGWILYKKHQYPWALSLLLDSAAKLPDSAEIQVHLGLTQYMKGEEASARQVLQRALLLDKKVPGYEEAARCLSILAIDAKTAGPDVLADLEKTVTQRPNDPVALARLGVIYARAGLGDKAVKAFQAALQVSPNNVAVRMDLIRLYASNGETPKALDLAKIARKLDPDDPEVAHLLGRLAFQTRDYVWAGSLLQEADRKKPDDPEVLFDLAEAIFSLGRVRDAEAAMLHAVNSNPNFPRADKARLFLEMVKLAAHPSKESRISIEQALRTNPNYVPALFARAALGELDSDQTTAAQDYEKVLGIFPNFAPATRFLAIHYASISGNNQKAYDLAMKARETFADDPQLTKALGLIVYRMGDYNRAANLLRDGASQLRLDAEIFYYLGMAQYHLKQWNESRVTLRGALSLDPNAKLAPEAQRILTELK